MRGLPYLSQSPVHFDRKNGAGTILLLPALMECQALEANAVMRV